MHLPAHELDGTLVVAASLVAGFEAGREAWNRAQLAQEAQKVTESGIKVTEVTESGIRVTKVVKSEQKWPRIA